LYGVNGATLASLYKYRLSGYTEWEGMKVLEDSSACYVLYPQNCGKFLSIDETALSRDEVFTIVTNKDGHGGKGTLVAMISSIASADIIAVLRKIDQQRRLKVREITCDLSAAMMESARSAFPFADVVNDRFHVQQLFTEAMDEIRIDIRHQVRREENEMKEFCQENGQEFVPRKMRNGETMPQILLRSKHALMMAPNKIKPHQKERLEILFEFYPLLKTAYDLMGELRRIFNMNLRVSKAGFMLNDWFEKVVATGNESFKQIIRTFKNNYKTILGYFKRRSTNASAESFNAKIKMFRTQLRGICDPAFFIFRLQKLFA